ncbi:MAG: flavodoxin family protein [Lachnospiraceae bacterium]|jgi:multimeric flavodoxin WrbA|nr:flavodoxin family protein [Lachnospiraceae bacterium]MCI9448496.1 flavodoxin family protein [Lachnospiraceae bacterium]MCX4315341.1 flavodoxin family protein [Lachnospiraceae bacterium]
MKIAIFMGSPRQDGNTAELLKPFLEELQTLKKWEDIIVQYITIADKTIAPCKGCYTCQQVSGIYGCCQQDDMWQITGQMLWADVMVLATPIYTWFCPAQMKAMLDRLYGLNKYYGSSQTPPHAMLAGKGLALITTHGYDRDYGAGSFETGIIRYCEHSHLHYFGMYSVQDTDNKASFQTEEAKAGARAFAQQLVLDWMNLQG